MRILNTSDPDEFLPKQPAKNLHMIPKILQVLEKKLILVSCNCSKTNLPGCLPELFTGAGGSGVGSDSGSPMSGASDPGGGGSMSSSSTGAIFLGRKMFFGRFKFR